MLIYCGLLVVYAQICGLMVRFLGVSSGSGFWGEHM